ncbi:MAG: major tail protein [Mediterraneibacter gnavus]
MQESETGEITFDTPFAVPGSVSLSLEAQGELTPFYADGIKYYVSSSNSGYEGDWEMALITDEFREKILSEYIDKNKVMLEEATAKVKRFALGFEIDGDVRGTRFWFYCFAPLHVLRQNPAQQRTRLNLQLTLSQFLHPLYNLEQLRKWQFGQRQQQIQQIIYTKNGLIRCTFQIRKFQHKRRTG